MNEPLEPVRQSELNHQSTELIQISPAFQPDAYPEVSTDVGRAVTDQDSPCGHTPAPTSAQLSPIDDNDAVSNITFLDLDDDWSSNGVEPSQHSQPQRFTAGMPRRVFYVRLAPSF